MNVTRWFSTHDHPARVGWYEVQFAWPGRPVLRVWWDGANWRRIGKFKASPTWGDVWRGMTGPA